jgi:hypothetical protein
MSRPSKKPAATGVRQRPLDAEEAAWVRCLAEEALRQWKSERAEEQRERAA